MRNNYYKVIQVQFDSLHDETTLRPDSHEQSLMQQSQQQSQHSQSLQQQQQQQQHQSSSQYRNENNSTQLSRTTMQTNDPTNRSSINNYNNNYVKGGGTSGRLPPQGAQQHTMKVEPLGESRQHQLSQHQHSLGFESFSTKNKQSKSISVDRAREYEVNISYLNEEDAARGGSIVASTPVRDMSDGNRGMRTEESFVVGRYEDDELEQINEHQNMLRNSKNNNNNNIPVRNLMGDEKIVAELMNGTFQENLMSERVMALQEEVLTLRRNNQEAAEFYARHVGELQQEIEHLHETIRVQSLAIKENGIEQERLQMELQRQSNASHSQIDNLINKIRSIDVHTEQVFARKLDQERLEKEEVIERNCLLSDELAEAKKNLNYCRERLLHIEASKDHALQQTTQKLNEQIDEINGTLIEERKAHKAQLAEVSRDIVRSVAERQNASKIVAAREAETSKRIEEMESEIKRLTLELEKSGSGKVSMESSIRELQSQKDIMLSENQNLHSKLSALDSLLKEQMNKERHEQSEKQRKEAVRQENEEEACRNLLQEFEDRDSRITELENQLQGAAEDLAAAQTCIQQMVERENSLNSLVQETQQQCDAEAQKVVYFEQAFINADETNKQQAQRIMSLEAKGDKKMQKQGEVLQSLRKELETVCEHLQVATAENQVLRAKIKRVDSDNLDELAALKTSIDEGYAQLVEKQKESERTVLLQENITAQEKEIIGLKKKVREHEILVAKLNVDNETLVSNNAQKSAQIESLFSRLKQEYSGSILQSGNSDRQSIQSSNLVRSEE